MAEKLKPTGHTIYKDTESKRLPGVTTIIDVLAKPQLITWANRMGLAGVDTTKYVDNLADIGTLAHFLILCQFRGAVPDLSDFTENQIMAASNALVSFTSWKEHHELEPILVEQPLVSQKLRIGATPDFFGVLDGIATLIDFKTGRALYVEVLLQLAGYELILEEHEWTVEQARAVRVGREAGEGFEVIEFSKEDLLAGRGAFLSCLALYRQMQAIRKNHWKR